MLGDEDIGIEVVKRRKSSTVKDEHKNGKQVKHKEEIKPSLVFFFNFCGWDFIILNNFVY